MPRAQAAPPLDLGDLSELSLEELMNVEVTTVQGTAQSLQGTPAALYVISRDDIRRSGHRTLAEALRMVPGMFVARSGSHTFRLGTRGLTGNTIPSTKMLVLIDGRVVYDPLFSGTFWDVQDVVLEDLDRIEVIRGPGPTLWGLNAMNGVINVITRRASETLGERLRVGVGTTERASLSARHGGRIGDDTWYRIYGKYNDRGAFETPDGVSAHDDWSIARTGFRVDHDRADGVQLRLSGEVYRSLTYGIVDNVPVPAAHRVFRTVVDDGEIGGAHLIAAAEHAHGARSGWSAIAYYDRTEREQSAGARVERDTVSAGGRRWLPLGARNDFIWGGEAEYTRDDVRSSPLVVLDPASRAWGQANVFAQNTTALVPDRLYAMLGSKLSWHDFVGFELQPSARLWWTPSASQTFWTAVSRPARVPSRLEVDGRFTFAYVDTGLAAGREASGVYVPLEVRGNDALDAERADTFEAGWRAQLTPSFSLDAAIFHNDYCDLIAVPPTTYEQFDNLAEGITRGVELSSTWQVGERWRLEAAASWLDVSLAGPINDFENRNTPQRLAQVRSYYDLSDTVELNAAAYYVDALPLYAVDAHTRVDLGVTWHLARRYELSLAGQNLLAPGQRESRIYEVPRSFAARLTVRW